MTERKAQNKLYYFILFLVLSVLLVFLIWRFSNPVSTLAMEQQARCGINEHIHTQDCYIDQVLVCTQKQHTHSQNCYLVLLEDNDINWLLQVTNENEEKSLENVIDSTLVQALTLNEDFEGESPPLELTSENISSLNTTITENEIEPAVVFNENLSTGTTLLYTPLAISDEGVSTLAVGGTATTGARRINFYIRLDGKITYINGGTLENYNPDYYTYENIVAAYNYNQDKVVTNLTTDKISSTYDFWYNTKGPSSGFETKATYRNMQVRFRNNDSTYYAILTKSDNTPVNFYTVTLDYSEVDSTRESDIQYVESELSSTLTLSSAYLWYDTDGKEVTAIPTITETTTLYAKPKAFTASFVDVNGTNIKDSVTGNPSNGELTVTLPSLTGTAYEGYYWIIQGSDGIAYYTSDGTERVTITGDTTFVAVPSTYTVTFKDQSGNVTETVQVNYGSTVDLPELQESLYWISKDGSVYADIESPIITSDTIFIICENLIVTYIFADGTTSSENKIPGTQITLGNTSVNTLWIDDENNIYEVGESVTVIRNTTFTERPYLTITYNINYNSTSASNVGISGATVPTVMGETSYSHKLVQGFIETLYAVSETLATSPMPLTTNDRPGVARFEGWKVGSTSTLLQPGTSYSYSDLYAMATDGTLTLNGSWEYTRNYAVNFFVEFDSKADSTAASDFTKVVYNTYYGGNRQEYAKGTDHTINDKLLRALGEADSGDEAWLETFPSDEEIFAALESYAQDGSLSVNNISVSTQDLNDNGYTILWYSLAYVGSDSNYHIDGLLARRTGTLKVTKKFAGNKDAIEDIKNGDYSITAKTNTITEKTETLTLKNADAYDSASDTYTWYIENVLYGEEWTFKENNYGSPYAEYSITDALGGQATSGEYTDSGVTITAQTYGSSFSSDEMMSINFTNIYPGTDSIIIKKEDAATGQALAGAGFQLLQNGTVLCFDYNETSGVYTCNADGKTKTLSAEDGFIEILISGLDFTQGDITVYESKVPEGYSSFGNLVLTKDENGTIKISSGPDTSEMKNGVLIVGNTAVSADVQVKKDWSYASDSAKDVIVQLLANGEPVTDLFPNISTEVFATLTERNEYTYLWNDLPAYANGEKIEWTVREIQIGNEKCKSDYTFANWNVDYADAKTTIVDDIGNMSVELVVTNVKKAGNALMIIKTDSSGNRLSGAEFTLQMLNSDGTDSADFLLQSGISDDEGLILFKALPYGNYRLTETVVPAGYMKASEPVYFTINEDNSITIGSGNAEVLVMDGLGIRISNLGGVQLPSTGGVGTNWYTFSGLALICVAVGFMYKKFRRKEDITL